VKPVESIDHGPEHVVQCAVSVMAAGAVKRSCIPRLLQLRFVDYLYEAKVMKGCLLPLFLVVRRSANGRLDEVPLERRRVSQKGCHEVSPSEIVPMTESSGICTLQRGGGKAVM
jgi:hypothetical protein